jgi:DNA-directed RNA polymerase II subunit RPB2
MTYIATMSHLRRVNTMIEKTGKLVQPRKLHATQWGIICPSETPEGASVGLVKNMALLTTVTMASSSDAVRAEVVRLGLRRFDPTLPPADAVRVFEGGAVRVYVNGDLVGAHADPAALHAALRDLKRRGAINVFTSFAWNVAARELLVCTEGGRFVRPLLVCERGGRVVLDATPLAARLLGAGAGAGDALRWHELVLSGAVEYLDVDEANHALIAMSPDAVGAEGAPPYTHAEVSPYAMLGVVAGSIPFSDHNQAPRNTYQVGFGGTTRGVLRAACCVLRARAFGRPRIQRSAHQRFVPPNAVPVAG